MSAFSINTNSNALVALRHYSAVERGLDGIRNRVSTGLNVSGALDDSSTFAIAQGIRGDIKAWSAVDQALSSARGLLEVTIAAATQISDILGDIKKKFIEYFAADSARQPIIEDDIEALLDSIDIAANSATYNGVNLITTDDTGINAPQPPDEGVTQTLNHPGGGPTTGPLFTLGATAGTLRLNYELLSGSGGQLRIRHNGVTVASTGLGGPNAPGTLTWDYPGTAPQNFQIQVTGGAKDVEYSFFLDTPIDTSVSGSYQVLRDIQGSMINVQKRSMLSSDIEFSPAFYTSAETALAQIEAANKEVSLDLGYYGAKLNEIKSSQQSAQRFQDALSEGLGSAVDADMPREHARLTAEEVRQALSVETLSIANERPRIILDLLRF